MDRYRLCKWLLVAAIWAICVARSSGQSAVGSPMDKPLELIAEAQASYANVNDYSCLFVKRERVRGQLSPDNLIQMQVKTKPFSVYMRWIKPKDAIGQEVCFVEGRNNGKMRARSPGVLGVVGFVSIDPTDPRAMESNRHSITESGIGNLIDRYAARWQAARNVGTVQVQIGEFEYDKKRCIAVTTVQPDSSRKELSYYRSVVYFDKETKLPIRIENYDWPTTEGDPGGALLESYSFVNLKLNPGLNDIVFNK